MAANSMKPIGRSAFLFRLLLVTAVGFACEFLSRRGMSSQRLFPRELQTFVEAGIYCLIGMYSAKIIDGRLLDSGLPIWLRYPAYAVWLLATSLPFIWTREWPIGLALFLVLLIPGGLVTNKEISAKPAAADADKTSAESPRRIAVSDRLIPARLLIDPVSFLRSLLTFVCIALPLIWLDNSFHRGTGALIARLGYGVLYFVWVFKVFGRFADSGRSSNWYWFPFCIVATVASALPLWYSLLNRYEALTLFILIQVPLAFLPSMPRPEELAHIPSAGERYRQRVALRRGNAKPFVVERFAFLRRLLVIACIWGFLIFAEHASDGGVGMWLARCGYLILSFAWIMNASGRLIDANLAHNWYTSQYCLVVTVSSLMPLAVHWVNGYGALAIFVLIQIPMVLLRGKSMPNPPRGPRLGESRVETPHSGESS